MDEEFIAELLVSIESAIKENSTDPVDFSNTSLTIGQTLISSISSLVCKNKEDKIKFIESQCELMKIIVLEMHDETSSDNYIAKVLSRLFHE